MKIASLTEYNFSDERLKRESAREFICQFLDSSQVDIVMEMAFEMDMSVEKCTAYALAMFNSIQDLWYFHFNLKLGRITVTTSDKWTPVKDRDKVFQIRGYMGEPYFTNRTKRIGQIIAYLKKQSVKKERLDDTGGIKLKNPEKFNAKKEKERKKKVKAQNKKARAKRRRIKKKIIKNWGFKLVTE